MHRKAGKCPFCRGVNFLCFWGEMPVRAWKRPALLVASAAIAIVFLALGWFAEGEQDAGEQIAVVVGTLFGLAGTSIALFGCDKCAARVFGSV